MPEIPLGTRLETRGVILLERKVVGRPRSSTGRLAKPNAPLAAPEAVAKAL